MKIIFMGTPEFAVPTLQAIVDSKHEVVAVYSQPPRPAGRGKKERKSPTHTLAESQSIPVETPVSLRNEEAQRIFQNYKADIAVVAAYGLILPKEILEGTELGCINIHPSKLPRWRGAAPIQRPLMAGDTETAVGIMKMEAGLDTGPLYTEVDVPIPHDANAGIMHDMLAELGAKLLLKTLDALEMDNTIEPTPQSEEGVTYASKIDKSEALIDWNTSIQEIQNKIRGLSPTPCAYFHFNNEKYKILRSEFVKIAHDFPIATVLNEQLHIAAQDGILIPTIIQRQGKKAMPIEEFLKGNAIPPESELN